MGLVEVFFKLAFGNECRKLSRGTGFREVTERSVAKASATAYSQRRISFRRPTLKTLVFLTILAICAVPAYSQDTGSVGTKPEAPITSPQKPMRIRIGGETAAAQLTNRVQPAYPELARQVRLSGTVRLHAVISKDGSVQQLEVVSGHPLLVQSALDAVRKWKYKPTLLNGEPVEVDTTIDVIYSLNADKEKLAIDPQLRADILEMMKSMHVQETSQEAGKAVFEKLRPQLFTNIKDETLRAKITDSFLAKLLHTFDEEEFSEGVVTAYAKYFDDSEIKQLAKFYETPLGQKFNKVAGNLTADLMELGQTVA